MATSCTAADQKLPLQGSTTRPMGRIPEPGCARKNSDTKPLSRQIYVFRGKTPSVGGRLEPRGDHPFDGFALG
jgi:hypothetical protein